MRENTNVITNQNYLIGRTRQEEITTSPLGNLGGEENMREDSIKDTLILACDHGYGNIKSCHSVFNTVFLKHLSKSAKQHRSLARTM